ncbi:MAG: hypothetical protein GYA55_11870 [SAR324 cluster bacterium]|uniref:Uncharacterized protein n=1 Tax=SAR324 cluster bacterium TaxID=2024889 RepID=A0A7X9FTY9_9DELT|nr:hypothetical protein [SAR324 cluster bacterium]
MESIFPEYMAWRLLFGPDVPFPKFDRPSGLTSRELDNLRIFRDVGFKLMADIHKDLISGKLNNLSINSVLGWLHGRTGIKWEDHIHPAWTSKYQSRPKESHKDITRRSFLECEEANRREEAQKKKLSWIEKRDLNLEKDFLRCLRKNIKLSNSAWASDVLSNRPSLALKGRNQGGRLSKTKLRAIAAKARPYLMERWPVSKKEIFS